MLLVLVRGAGFIIMMPASPPHKMRTGLSVSTVKRILNSSWEIGNLYIKELCMIIIQKYLQITLLITSCTTNQRQTPKFQSWLSITFLFSTWSLPSNLLKNKFKNIKSSCFMQYAIRICNTLRNLFLRLNSQLTFAVKILLWTI